MKSMFKLLGLLAVTLFAPAAAFAQSFDLVILNARVIDPATSLDEVRNIGISGDTIAAVTREPITGKQTINATGLIAAPGFIDLHAHGQDRYSEKVSILDGRTSQLDLEAGALPVSKYFESKKGVSLSNHGVSVSHAGARLLLLDGIDPQGHPMVTHALEKAGKTGNKWASQLMTDEQLAEVDKLVIRGLEEGGLGIGVIVGYYPDARSEGIARMAQLAKAHNSFLTTHPRYLSLTAPSGILGQQEFLALALSYGVPLLLHHVPTNALAGTPAMLDMIDEANRRGANILAEAFPYVKGSTYIATRILDPGWQQRTGMDYDDLAWVETGETLTKETFEKYRRTRPEGMFIMEHIKRKDMMTALRHPEVIIASDGMVLTDEKGRSLPFDAPFGVGRGHPRSAGTYGRYLRLAIDDGHLTMPQILAKTSYFPARFLEEFAPSMKQRGRLQKGMFADITVFDPKTVDGVADYKVGTNSLPSKGFPHVIVNGVPVVRDGTLVKDVFPGQPIRGRQPQ